MNSVVIKSSIRRPPHCRHCAITTGFSGGEREGVSTSEREHLKALEREVKELRRPNEILKLASAFFAQAELDRRLKS